jgi:hypothetical protein
MLLAKAICEAQSRLEFINAPVLSRYQVSTRKIRQRPPIRPMIHVWNARVSRSKELRGIVGFNLVDDASLISDICSI